MGEDVEEGAEDEVELVEPALVPVQGGPRDDAFGRGARNRVPVNGEIGIISKNGVPNFRVANHLEIKWANAP